MWGGVGGGGVFGGGGGGGGGGLTWVLLVGLALGDGRVVAGEDAGDKLWSFLEKHKTTTLITEYNKQSTLTKCIELNHTVFSTMCA